MKKYLLGLLAIVSLAQSCKKESDSNNKRKDMPRHVTTFQQSALEISKRNGGTASIVLIAGYKSEMTTWEQLYKQLDPNMTVFTYNRPGVGRSADVPGKRDAQTIAKEMKAVLQANGVKPPYVFVAHSMGGIYARMFYYQNPSLVKGLVLVDATHERQIETLLARVDDEATRDFILQQMEANFQDSLAVIPAGSVKEEFRSNYKENNEQIKQFGPITNIPVYVLTSTKIGEDTNPVIVEITKNLHAQWAGAAGAKGKFVTTDKSGHYIQVEEPHLVAAGIRWVMQ
jgi:pimeloyl-ACP methyl ester carboxylesterase